MNYLYEEIKKYSNPVCFNAYCWDATGNSTETC